MRTAAFIIHLDRSSARRPQVDRLAGLLPLSTNVLSAIDGGTMTDDAYHRVVRKGMHSPPYPFLLSKGEAGCFLSHRAAWTAIVSSGLDAGLIVEDDVDCTSPDFAAVIQAAVDAIGPSEFLRFPFRARGEAGPVVRTRGKAQFMEPRLPGRGMLMQLVSVGAARLLLEASHSFDRPVDSFLQMQWLHGARVLSIRPIVIRHVDYLLGGTVLQSKQLGLAERLRREVQRPILRLAVRAANERLRWRAA